MWVCLCSNVSVFVLNNLISILYLNSSLKLLFELFPFKFGDVCVCISLCVTLFEASSSWMLHLLMLVLTCHLSYLGLWFFSKAKMPLTKTSQTAIHRMWSWLPFYRWSSQCVIHYVIHHMDNENEKERHVHLELSRGCSWCSRLSISQSHLLCFSRMPISRSRIFLLRFPCHRIKSSIEIETQMHSAGDNWWLFRKIDILLRSQETMIVCSTKYPCSVNCTETFCWEQSWLSSKRTLCLNCLSCFETRTFVWNDDERHETVWYARSWTRRQMTTWTFSGKEIIDLMMSTLSSYPAMKQPEMKEIHVESSSS